MNRIILASASPRRRELLSQIGIAYEVKPSQKEEVITKTVPADIVQELAYQKAMDIVSQWKGAVDAEQRKETVVVIGADTIVTLDGCIMGKPADDADACRMLSMLQGRTHQVYTGVCLAVIQNEEVTTTVFAESTDVHMYQMSEDEINAYVATGEPQDKAGAYAIQGGCAAYIKGISGDYNNVVGLPVARVYQELKQKGLLS